MKGKVRVFIFHILKNYSFEYHGKTLGCISSSFRVPPSPPKERTLKRKDTSVLYFKYNIPGEQSQKWELKTLLLCLFPLSWNYKANIQKWTSGSKMMVTCKVQTTDFLLLLTGQRRHHLFGHIYSTLCISWNWRGTTEKEIQITEWNIKI